MHPNPIFRQEGAARNLAFARERSFGVLAVAADGLPLLSHVPFLLSPDGSFAELHLVRSNPICRAVKEPAPARIAVSGADGYISPDWYGLGPDQVPTWNYVAVHLTGRLVPQPPETLARMLEAQSAEYEGRLPKRPWTLGKMSPEARDRLLRMILPFRFEISEVDGTWKLGQNKPEAAQGAAAGQLQTGFGQELEALERLMRPEGLSEDQTGDRG